MNTDDERAIVDAATPGPWEPHRNRIGYGWTVPSNAVDADLRTGMRQEDAKFIARARTVLPLALDVVAAAEAWSEADEKWGSGMTDVPPAFRLDGLRAALDAWKEAQ